VCVCVCVCVFVCVRVCARKWYVCACVCACVCTEKETCILDQRVHEVVARGLAICCLCTSDSLPCSATSCAACPGRERASPFSPGAAALTSVL